MKKIYINIITLFVALVTFSSCNDEWKDELYSHMVSLKAPINNKEVCSIYVRYKSNGEVIYNLPVLVSGSTPSDKSLDVRIAVDPDTLATLNEANYHDQRRDLWYDLLPQSNYEFPSPTCHIPAGSRKELFPIKFKFSGMNLSKEWVLPLTIEEDPSYVTNKRKGWRKALLHVLPFNDYSGNYSATAMNIYFDDSNDDPLVVDERRAHVVDENTVFFYAGTKADDAIDRETYKINVKFEEPSEVTETSKKGNLTITAENPSINFQLTGHPTYEIWEEMDSNQPYLMHRYYVLYIKYTYNDITTSNVPTAYRAEGSLTMERKINTMIPDEDQAIQW